MGTYMKAASELHCKNQRSWVELLLHFLHYYCLISDKICFKKSVLHSNNSVWFGQGSSILFLNFSFRQHLEVAISSWCCFSEITSRDNSFSRDVLPVLGLNSQQLSLCKFSVPVKKVCNSLKQKIAGIAVHGISGYICLKVSCSHRYFYPIFCYWDMVSWWYKRSYFKNFSLPSELLYK